MVGGQRDVDLFGFLCGRIEPIDIAGIFEDDQLPVRAWELDIIFDEVGYLRGRFCFCIVDKEVHRPVAVGEEIDFVADPHREDVLCMIVRDVLDRFLSGVLGYSIRHLRPGPKRPAGLGRHHV